MTSERSLPQELDKFIADIGNANIGVHYALSNLYNGLLGQTGTGNGRRLLDVWHENAYRRLADANDLNYTIPNYVDDMDTKLEAVLELIRNGLILLIMTTKGMRSNTLVMGGVASFNLCVLYLDRPAASEQLVQGVGRKDARTFTDCLQQLSACTQVLQADL